MLVARVGLLQAVKPGWRRNVTGVGFGIKSLRHLWFSLLCAVVEGVRSRRPIPAAMPACCHASPPCGLLVFWNPTVPIPSFCKNALISVFYHDNGKVTNDVGCCLKSASEAGKWGWRRALAQLEGGSGWTNAIKLPCIFGCSS